MIGPGTKIEIHITATEPLEGFVAVDGGPTRGFCGWGELRRLVAAPMDDLDAGLTQTEEQIVSLVSEGLTNKEIGRRLYLSPRTVQWHLGRAFRKLGVRSRTELAARWSADRG